MTEIKDMWRETAYENVRATMRVIQNQGIHKYPQSVMMALCAALTEFFALVRIHEAKQAAFRLGYEAVVHRMQRRQAR